MCLSWDLLFECFLSINIFCGKFFSFRSCADNIIYAKEDSIIYEIVHKNGSPNCFKKLSEHLFMNRYVQVPVRGLLKTEQEQMLKEALGNWSNNPMPLRYDENLRKIVHE